MRLRASEPRLRRQHARGFSLLEISLAVAIAATLAAIAIPATGGWMAERAVRMELENFAVAVMEMRREAERTGEPRTLYLGAPEEGTGESATVFLPSEGFDLFRMDRAGKWASAMGSQLRIQPGGIVPPARFKLTNEDRWVVFRFDPLTGHLEEQEFQF